MTFLPTRVLTRMRTVTPASPRLVWYGAEGRIELSGRVFDNWVAKTSNLLMDELDVQEGTRVLLDLPVHWKTLALAFACWQTGALAVLPAGSADEGASEEASDGMRDDTGTDSPDADVVASDRTGVVVGPEALHLCVALGSLALRWDEGPLPSGAVDYAAEIRSHADVYLGDEAEDPEAPAVRRGDTSWTAGQLAARLPLAAGGQAGSRTVLLEPGTDVLEVLGAALTVWEHDGTLVLVEEGVPVTDRLLTGEAVTDRPGTA